MAPPISEIYKQFSRELKTFIQSKVPEDADDILQETFIRIHSAIDTLRDETRLQSWIYQITRNVISDHFRKLGREIRNNDFTVIPDQDTPDEVMSEAVEDMIRMMDQLPPEYCEALCLTELKGLSQKQYAEMAGISYTAARSRVQRARKMLRDTLMRCCHYQFDTYGTVIGIYPPGCCCC
jgi:RNA polymerase sigma-70 factor, ECF subfamily